MTFIMSIVSQMCFLVAVLMMCSVSGRGIDNLREEAKGERAIAESTDSEQSQGEVNTQQENIVCGQKQIQTSKRDEKKGGLNNHDDSDNLDKLLGGSNVTHGDVPWQANIYFNGWHVCGGAIISEYWVLTTASCLYNRHEGSYLVLGDNRLSQTDAGQRRYTISEILVSNKFINGVLDYDFALIQVLPHNGRGILFNNYVQPICLPGPGEGPTDDDWLTISGWGDDTIVVGHTTDRLKKIDLAVMNKQKCISWMRPGVITDRMLCTFLMPNSGVCYGDEGAPATYQIGDSHILVGLVVTGFGCQSPDSPVILTNVLAYRDMIYSAINLYSDMAVRQIPSRSG